jgi:hypothetical protein
VESLAKDEGTDEKKRYGDRKEETAEAAENHHQEDDV